MHISTFPQNRQVQKSQKEMRDLRRYGPSYLLTTETMVDGDRAEPMPSTLLLAVLYIACCSTLFPFKLPFKILTTSYEYKIRMIRSREVSSLECHDDYTTLFPSTCWRFQRVRMLHHVCTTAIVALFLLASSPFFGRGGLYLLLIAMYMCCSLLSSYQRIVYCILYTW